VTNIFTGEEIQDLEKIVTFFNESICKSENIDSVDVDECYEQFFIRMHKAADSGKIDIQILHQSQDKLIADLDKNTVDQIWLRTDRIMGSDTLEALQYRRDGKFVEFLRALGQDNENVKDYVELLEIFGIVSPSMLSDPIVNYQEYNIQDKRMKLMIAVHYLTLNEQNRK